MCVIDVIAAAVGIPRRDIIDALDELSVGADAPVERKYSLVPDDDSMWTDITEEEYAIGKSTGTVYHPETGEPVPVGSVWRNWLTTDRLATRARALCPTCGHEIEGGG